MNRVCRSLLSVLLALAFCAPAAAAKRDCQFSQDPSGPGNFFEPPAWPMRLGPNYFHLPGIVRPTHDHFYLYIAYRALNGIPPDGRAQERLAPFDPCLKTPANSHRGYEPAAAPALVAARKLWDARRLAAGAGKPPTPGASEEANCHADAFRNAARTLDSRIASHGNDARIGDWIAAQDAVFAICTGAAPLPADAASDAPLWLRQDRAYQQAAAALYKGEHADAARRFDLIAADVDSPWSAGAPYQAARADIRGAIGEDKDAALERGRARLEPLADAAEPSVLRTDARRLLQMARLKSHPKELLAQLDAQLSGVELPESIGQDLYDFAPAYYAGGGRERDDLAFGAWFTAMRGKGAGAEQAARRWRETGEAAWLVAALTLSKSDTPGLAPLLEQAALIAPTAPSYMSVSYHQARLTPRHAAALTRVDAVLAQNGNRTEDANALRRIGLARATSLASAARFLARTNAMPHETGALPSVDIDGANLLNTGLSVDLLVAISQMPAVPPALRREVATMAWTRAFILKRPELMTKLAPDIKAAFPAAASLIGNMLKESDPMIRRAAGAMLLARFPGMVANARAIRIGAAPDDGYSKEAMHNATSRHGERVNWWCEFPESGYALEKELRTVTPHFLSPVQRKALMAERAQLAATPNATDYLAALVMEHAAREPGDERLPDALSRLIRGDGGCAEGKLTKAMFRHLHKHFKRSAAARRTPTHR